jgi:hypothetical protein
MPRLQEDSFLWQLGLELNGESKNPGIGQRVEQFLNVVFRRVKDGPSLLE